MDNSHYSYPILRDGELESVMRKNWQAFIHVCYWLYHHRRLLIGILLWLIAMFCLATAAEGINKVEWILIGAIPITLLTIGFIIPRRIHPAVVDKDTIIDPVANTP